MEKIKIITDSCSDLPLALVEEYDISMLPTPVHFGEQLYHDRGNLFPEEFYQKIDQGNDLPKTSQITPTAFQEEFEKALAAGFKVLSINFSSKLSGILQSAILAKKEIGSADVHIIDSRCASVGFGMSVIKAARLIRQGMGLTEVIQETLQYCSQMEHIFAVGSLEMLKRGGRISKTSALIGSVLNIKPILHFQNGEILPLNKVRGSKKMYDYLLEIMAERGDQLPEQELIGINHSGNPAMAEKMKEKIMERFGIKQEKLIISEIGAAIGSHVGRNTVSVFFQNKDKVAEAELH